MLMIFFRFSICAIRQNGFSLIFTEETEVSMETMVTMETDINKFIPFWMSILIIVAIFCIQLLIINRLILVYYLILTVLLLVFTSLIKCLIDRAYKIKNTWASFHNDVTKIKETLKRNSFPPFLIGKIAKSYLNKAHNNIDQSNPESDKTRFYKLPYIRKYSVQAQKKLSKICKQFYKDTDLKIAFTPFKINNYFSIKDKIPYFLKSFLVYKFVSARCNSCYIGQTCHHFKTRIDEHVKNDKKSNTKSKRLRNNEEYFSRFNSDCCIFKYSSITDITDFCIFKYNRFLHFYLIPAALLLMTSLFFFKINCLHCVLS